MTIPEATAYLGMGGVPIIVAMTTLVKRVWPTLPDTLYPVVALTWALLLNAGLGTYLGNDPVLGTVAGVLAALAANGLYSGGRTVLGV
jgi:hypothetical protein